MAMPRRGFLKTGILAAVASALPLSIHRLAFARAPVTTNALRHAGFAQFSACIDDWFTVVRDTGPVDRLRLVRLVDLRSEALRRECGLGQRECFALLFSGAGGRGGSLGLPLRSLMSKQSDESRLSEGTYQLHHGRLGEFPLAISPAGSDLEGPLYSAVINRSAG